MVVFGDTAGTKKKKENPHETMEIETEESPCLRKSRREGFLLDRRGASRKMERYLQAPKRKIKLRGKKRSGRRRNRCRRTFRESQTAEVPGKGKNAVSFR